MASWKCAQSASAADAGGVPLPQLRGCRDAEPVASPPAPPFLAASGPWGWVLLRAGVFAQPRRASVMLRAADHGSKRCIQALFCSLLPQASPIRSASFMLRSRMVHPRLYSTQLPRSGVGIFCPSQTKFFIFLSVCGSIPQFPIFIIEITWPNPERSTLGDCKLSNPSTWDMLLQQHGSYRNAVHWTQLNLFSGKTRTWALGGKWRCLCSWKEDGTQTGQASSPWTKLWMPRLHLCLELRSWKNSVLALRNAHISAYVFIWLSKLI